LLAVVLVCVAGIAGAADRGPSLDRVNEAIEDCVYQGWLEGATKAAKLAGRSLTVDELNEIVDHRVYKGDITGAKEAAKLAGRSLTVDELNEIVDTRTTARGWGYGVAFEALKLGASPDRAEALRDACIRSGLLECAVEVGKLVDHPLTADEIDSLVDRAARQGDLEGARKAAKIARCSLTVDEINALVDSRIRRSSSYYGGWDVLEVAKLGASIDRVDAVVSFCIKHGWSESAKEAAKLAGRSLTVDELNEIADRDLKGGQYSGALEAVKLGASPDRVERILQGCLTGEYLDCFIEALKLSR
jgi:hypothetical protein